MHRRVARQIVTPPKNYFLPPLPSRRRTKRSRLLQFEPLETRNLLTSSAPLQIKFDYTLDTKGFFEDTKRREILEFAAQKFESRIQTSLSEIPIPIDDNTWTANVIRPDVDKESIELVKDKAIPENTYVVYVGGRDIPSAWDLQQPDVYPTTRAFGYHGGQSSFGSSAWNELTSLRGTDFSPGWGGTMTFDTGSDTKWFFGKSIGDMKSNEIDFLSFAVHELGHVFGLDHLPEGLMSDGQEVAMAPSLNASRALFTTRDWEAMKDAGWDISGLSLVDVNPGLFLAGAAYVNGADREALSFNDIRQGASDTCAFSATLSSVAITNFDLASGIRLKSTTASRSHTFEVRMYKDTGGTRSPVWVDVPFDDALAPEDLQSNDPGEFWTALYLRAYLTFSDAVDGNYHSTSESLAALTGLANTRLTVDGSIAQAQAMKNALDHGSPIVISSRDVDGKILESQFGLISNHAYSVMGMEVPSTNLSDVYVTVRNPWAADTSWTFFDTNGDGKLSLTESTAAQYGVDGVDDGIIRLPWAVFVSNFTDIVISHLQGPSINEPKTNQLVQFLTTNLGPYTVGTGEVLSVKVKAKDPEGAFVTYALSPTSPGYIQLQTGEYRWEPKANEVGDRIVTITAEVSPFESATITFVVHVIPKVPHIESLTASPTSIDASGADRLTLTAENVTTDIGAVSYVEFWRDQDGNGIFSEHADSMIGMGSPVGGEWSWSGYVGGLSKGTQKFFARAARYSYNDIHVGDPVATTVTITQAPLPDPEAIAVTDPIVTAGFSAQTPQYLRMVALREGGYRAIWQDASDKVFTRIIDASGNGVGNAKQLTPIVDIASDLDFAIVNDGRFVVAWVEAFKLYGQWFTSDGTALGGKLQLDSIPQSAHDGIYLEVAAASTGDAVVGFSNGSYFDEDVYATSFQWNGTTTQVTRPVWMVNTFTQSTQSHPSVAINEKGDGVIAWRDQTSKAFFARRLVDFGKLNSDILTVYQSNQFIDSHLLSATAVNAKGEFIIAFTAKDGDGNGVYARYYNSDGTPRGSEFLVNTFQGKSQYVWDVALNDLGWSTVTWSSEGQDPGDGVQLREVGVYAQLYDPTGRPAGPEFPVHTSYAGSQFPTGITIDGDADLNILWIDYATFEVYSRQFATNLPPALSNNPLPVIAENSAMGTVVGSLQAVDPDGHGVRYAIVGDSPLAIDPISGQLTIATAGVIDFETTSVVTVSVRISDDQQTPKSVLLTLEIPVQDVNEVPDVQNSNFTIPELSEVGKIVGKVLAHDQDYGDFLTYSLASGTPFKIDPQKGVITVGDQTALDFESKNSYTLSVTVADRLGLQDSATITVQLTDVDDQSVNVAPSVSNIPSAVFYVDGEHAASLFARLDVILNASNLAGGRLRVENISFAYDDDRIQIAPVNGLTVSNGQILWNGTAIGTMTDDGVGRHPLQIQLNDRATATALKALLEAIEFQTPAIARPSAMRTLRITLFDAGDVFFTATLPLVINNPSDRQAGIFTITGTNEDDIANVDDTSAIESGQLKVSLGTGNDILRISGAGRTLDLVPLTNSEIQGVETIDLRGSGANVLKISPSAITGLSLESDTLRVIHDQDDSIDFGNGWTAERPRALPNDFVHVITQGQATIEIVNPYSYKNPLNALDSTRDGNVAPIDVLVVINTLNSQGPRSLAPPSSIDANATFFYFDVNGDNSVAPIDALIIINYLNRNGGESESVSAAPSNFAGLDSTNNVSDLSKTSPVSDSHRRSIVSDNLSPEVKNLDKFLLSQDSIQVRCPALYSAPQKAVATPLSISALDHFFGGLQ